MTRDGRLRGRGEDCRVDLRPVVWGATIVTPREDRGVTIVIRATYRTLEEICLDLVAVTESSAGPVPESVDYAGAATFSRFFLSSSAS
jgi:hypothetical protein